MPLRVSGKPSSTRIAGAQCAKQKAGERGLVTGATEAPKKKPRRDSADADKTWVCPFAGCGHRMVSASAGHVAHIGSRHCREAKAACRCIHGCTKCIPLSVRDESCAELRWAVVSGDGAKVAQEL